MYSQRGGHSYNNRRNRHRCSVDDEFDLLEATCEIERGVQWSGVQAMDHSVSYVVILSNLTVGVNLYV